MKPDDIILKTVSHKQTMETLGVVERRTCREGSWTKRSIRLRHQQLECMSYLSQAAERDAVSTPLGPAVSLSLSVST